MIATEEDTVVNEQNEKMKGEHVWLTFGGGPVTANISRPVWMSRVGKPA